MSVITISRETGSGGRYIAEKVAQTLGYTLVDKDTIGEVYSKYASDEFGMDVGYVPDMWTRFDSPQNERRVSMVDILNQVILALAHADHMVIVGRSSFSVLTGFLDVLNVRIQAPLPIRIKRVTQRPNTSNPAQAETFVRQSDKARAAFIEGFYGSQWDMSNSFDLVIDTGKISRELAIGLLIQAVQELPAAPISGSRTLNTIQVVPVLSSIVAQELNRISALLPSKNHREVK